MMDHFVFDSVSIITDFHFCISYFPYFSINLSISKRHNRNSFQKLFVFSNLLFYIHLATINYMIVSFYVFCQILLSIIVTTVNYDPLFFFLYSLLTGLFITAEKG